VTFHLVHRQTIFQSLLLLAIVESIVASALQHIGWSSASIWWACTTLMVAWPVSIERTS
jgi:hypothetical protein